MIEETIIITGEALYDFFGADAELLDRIKSREIKAGVILILDLGEDGYSFQYAAFEEVPTEQDIANTHVWESDGAEYVVEFLNAWKLWETEYPYLERVLDEYIESQEG